MLEVLPNLQHPIQRHLQPILDISRNCALVHVILLTQQKHLFILSTSILRQLYAGTFSESP